MTFKSLVKALCKREGKTRQVDIANMSETLKALFDEIHDPDNACVHTPFYGLWEREDLKRTRAAEKRDRKK